MFISQYADIFRNSCLRNTGIKYDINKRLVHNNFPPWPLGHQNFISTPSPMIQESLLTIHANHFKFSVRRSPRTRVSKDVITSTALKHNWQIFLCFQLVHCGDIRFLERIYRHFLLTDKISGRYFM